MAYLIATYDKPGLKHVRDSLRQRHIEWLEGHIDKVLAGGGFTTDDDSAVFGGLILLDVASRAEAEAFLADDPFTEGDLFERVEITRWRPTFLDRKRIQPART